MDARVVLIGKPGCHLCDNARLIIASVCDELQVTWEEKSILDDPALADQYFAFIPVVLIDGAQHDQFRLDPQRFRSALLK
ncbi:MAG: glutaredoxin family protein [Actinomycetes bacterium]